MPKLFVIPGHGAGDPGAGAFGFNEAERVRALATRIKALGGNNVTLADFNRNYYADNGISNLNISKDYAIIELHMDSAVSSARGGHVIIKSGFSADQYDNALASFIGSYFPGRSSKIVGRSNLANVNRAASKGYNYRLLECCFISNKDDLSKFNQNLDAVATGILNAFGISTTQAPKGTDVQLYPSNSTDAQKFVFEYTGATKNINGKECKSVRIKNVSSGKYLDLTSGIAKINQKVQVYPANGSNAQLWYEDPNKYDSDLFVRLFTAVDTNYCLDVPGAAKADGTKLQIYKPNGTVAQKFVKVYAGSSGTYYIMNQGSGKSLDVVGGGK